MGKIKSGTTVPEKQYFHNIISRRTFKFVLDDFIDLESSNDKALMEKVLIGAMSAIILDCTADVKNVDLKLEKTKKHYLEYSKIAQKANLDRADIKEFVLKIESLCLTKVVEINP